MSNIRPLATVAVLAAIALFLIKEIQTGGGNALDSGFGLEPAEIAMVSEDAEADAPPFYSEPALSAGEASTTAPLAPPTFTDSPVESDAAPLFEGDETASPADGGELPPLPELPPIDDVEGQPLPDDGVPPGAAMAGPAMSLSAPPGNEASNSSAGNPLAPPANVPVARYPDQPVSEAPAEPQLPPPGTVTGSVRPETPYQPPAEPTYDAAADTEPSFDSYPTSETTPLSFGEAPSAPGATNNDWQAAQAALSSGDLVTAHRLLSKLRDSETLPPQQRQEVERLVSNLAGTLIYDSREHRLAPPHYVQPGETLETIAAKYQVPWRLLAKINGVATPDGVRPGQTLKVVRGPFSAVVDQEAGEVVLMLGEAYAGRFPARVSLPPSPASQLRVESKSDGASPSLVLSGAAHPVTVGADTGRYGGAAVSLQPTDAAEIADILSVGSRVTIRR